MGGGSLGSPHSHGSAPIICGTCRPAIVLSDSVPLFTSIEFKKWVDRDLIHLHSIKYMFELKDEADS